MRSRSMIDPSVHIGHTINCSPRPKSDLSVAAAERLSRVPLPFGGDESLLEQQRTQLYQL